MIALLTLLIAMAPNMSSQAKPTVEQPATARKPVTETLHGVEISDPYRWLEDQKSKPTRAWIDKQNAYSDQFLKTLPARTGIEKRLLELQQIDRYITPIVRGNRLFFSLRRPQDDQPILYVQDGLKGKPRVLVDPHPLDKKHTTSVEFMDITQDGKLAAYAIRRGGDDQIEIRFRDVATGIDRKERLAKDFHESFSFDTKRGGYYYATLKPLVGRRLRWHKFGTPKSKDAIIFGEDTGAEDFIEGVVSENGRWLVITVSHGWSKNDVYVRDLKANGPMRLIAVGLDATFAATFAGNRLIVRTDYKAPNRRIVEILIDDPSPESWRVLVPEGKDAIETSTLAAGKLFVQYLHNVQSRIAVFDLAGTRQGEVKLPGLGTAGAPSGEWAGKRAFTLFWSYTTPRTILSYDAAKRKTTVWAQPKAPVNPKDFVIEQIWYASKDGTKVPMFLIHKKGTKRDGKRPTLLYAYGGFNASEVPVFDPEAILWAEHGGVYAVANLRGGGEFGEAWHKAGMLGNKQNVFDDFRAAAEWLTANKITNAKKLAISGVSNGGLLVCAAVAQFPELFNAVVCGFPLEDMIRYHKFLQGPQWVPEYGSADNEEQFTWLYAYSPYHHIEKGKKYPSVLFITGDADTRVAPLHARKMCALLQWANASKNPILLHYETTTGHSGGEPLSKRVKSQSLEMGYLFWQLGVK